MKFSSHKPATSKKSFSWVHIRYSFLTYNMFYALWCVLIYGQVNTQSTELS
jgi:hypothetical protein